MIEAEHAQTDRTRGTPAPDDHWEDYADRFKADPRRSDDPLLDRLIQQIKPHHTVIDVGAGAGRLSLPLALQCRHVTAIEPSPRMSSALTEQAAEYDISNVSLVQAGWEEAEVDPADIVLCVHVIYTIRDIERFVRKLEGHAKERVLVILFKDPPQSQNYHIWSKVHEEERLPLPGLPQFQEVLQELSIDAQTEMLPTRPVGGFDSVEQAMKELSSRLYLTPESPKMLMLKEVLPDFLEEVDGVYQMRGAKPLEPGLVWWP